MTSETEIRLQAAEVLDRRHVLKKIIFQSNRVETCFCTVCKEWMEGPGDEYCLPTEPLEVLAFRCKTKVFQENQLKAYEAYWQHWSNKTNPSDKQVLPLECGYWWLVHATSEDIIRAAAKAKDID